MVCLTTPTYTLNLNGAHFGYFLGKRGLTQGDPLSPLLFCICMEYLTRIMNYAADKWYFRYHPLCNSLKLNHLLFADDLLMFCKGDTQFIMLLLRVIATFSTASGLKVNHAKSEVVFNGVFNGVTTSLKDDIIQVSGFQEGNLPFKYLGVPIQPGRLLRKDCRVLTDKIVRKIRAICRNFLWESGTDYNRSPLVAWSDICYTKKEGGLGIKNVGVWNVASVGSWCISYIPKLIDIGDCGLIMCLDTVGYRKHTPMSNGTRKFEIRGIYLSRRLLNHMNTCSMIVLRVQG
ncbi:uncharacterized protein LOC141629487 [Silene latifolia]|uniref:uncharacterized protein LOC141629487 n=1 Tax=Silene latifolia TaxID=37657 RepID=UPI003D778E23